MKPIRRLLVIRLSALGDICMTIPVIESACLAYPNVEFTLLTSKVGAIVVNTVLQLPNLKVRSINKKDYNGLWGLNRLYAELKSLQFDAVADLHDVLRTKWVDFRYRISGHPVRKIEKGRAEKKALVAHAIHRQLTTSLQRYREVFSALGMEFAINYDGFVHGQTLLRQKAAHSMQDGQIINSEFAIGIAPFAQHKGKVYPAQKMCMVIAQLVRKFPTLKVYLFGSREEKAVLDVWASAHPANVINLAGAQNISDDLMTMARLRVMVSMDSANMHLASLVGLRCVSVWGATHPYAGFLGYGQSEDDCVALPLSCRPCSIYGNKPCKTGDFQCMNGLQPEIVAARIEAILLEKA